MATELHKTQGRMKTYKVQSMKNCYLCSVNSFLPPRQILKIKIAFFDKQIHYRLCFIPTKLSGYVHHAERKDGSCREEKSWSNEEDNRPFQSLLSVANDMKSKYCEHYCSILLIFTALCTNALYCVQHSEYNTLLNHPLPLRCPTIKVGTVTFKVNVASPPWGH